MKRYLISLTIVGMFAIFFLYRLPRTVVKNEGDSSIDSHSFNMTAADALAITSLKNFIKGGISENYITFADSLARYYLKYGFLDSAKIVTMKILQRDSSLQTQKKAPNLLYASYERASNIKEAEEYAQEARKVLSLITQRERDNLSAKTKELQQKILCQELLLREVQKTRKQRGFLVWGPCGQYERGVERFEKLLALKEDDYEAMLYMGVCLLEINKPKKSSELFTKIVAAENVDPALKSAAAKYLEN